VKNNDSKSFLSKFKHYLTEETLNINNLMPKENLHQDFWIDMNLDPVVLRKLSNVANDVMENLQISEFIEDIILTGSIASYNWHSLSDIDLHFVFNFSKINEDVELVKKMLDLARMKWNKDHKILIFGHEVEIYFQDANEEHESSGVFSILRDEWVENPVVSSKRPSNLSVTVKSIAIIREIDRIQELFVEKRYNESYHYSKSLKRKIRNMRKAGLTRDGVFSVENMAFKVLRNNEKLSLLGFLKNASYDKIMGVNKLTKIKVEKDAEI
jgi:predicted nucleotidyltransferase